MKQLLLMALLIGSFLASNAQMVQGNTVRVKDSLFLVDTWIRRFSANINLAENSDNIIPTQKAVRTYINSLVGPGLKAANGLHKSADSLKLGGQIIDSTWLDLNNNWFTIFNRGASDTSIVRFGKIKLNGLSDYAGNSIQHNVGNIFTTVDQFNGSTQISSWEDPGDGSGSRIKGSIGITSREGAQLRTSGTFGYKVEVLDRDLTTVESRNTLEMQGGIEGSDALFNLIHRDPSGPNSQVNLHNSYSFIGVNSIGTTATDKYMNFNTAYSSQPKIYFNRGDQNYMTNDTTYIQMGPGKEVDTTNRVLKVWGRTVTKNGQLPDEAVNRFQLDTLSADKTFSVNPIVKGMAVFTGYRGAEHLGEVTGPGMLIMEQAGTGFIANYLNVAGGTKGDLWFQGANLDIAAYGTKATMRTNDGVSVKVDNNGIPTDPSVGSSGAVIVSGRLLVNGINMPQPTMNTPTYNVLPQTSMYNINPIDVNPTAGMIAYMYPSGATGTSGSIATFTRRGSKYSNEGVVGIVKNPGDASIPSPYFGDFWPDTIKFKKPGQSITLYSPGGGQFQVLNSAGFENTAKTTGTNPIMGRASFAAGTTEVTINTTAVTADSYIFLSIETYSDGIGSTASSPIITAKTAGTSFKIGWSKSSGISGTILWEIKESR